MKIYEVITSNYMGNERTFHFANGESAKNFVNYVNSNEYTRAYIDRSYGTRETKNIVRKLGETQQYIEEQIARVKYEADVCGWTEEIKNEHEALNACIDK